MISFGGLVRIVGHVVCLCLATVMAGCIFTSSDTSVSEVPDSWAGGDGGVFGDGDGDGDSDGDGDGDSDGDIDAEIVPPIEEPVEPPEEEPECDVENEVVLYLSADDSNSMAGPVIARQAIREGSYAYLSGPIRIYEFLNYYSFDYAAADAGELRVSAQMRPTDDEVGDRFDLQIGVRAPDMTEAERRPLNITLSLDTSGSMGGNPIDLVRESCMAIATSLREGDVISMVTWSDSQNIILNSHVITNSDDPVLVGACAQIDSNGGTNLHSGLMTAYTLARENFSPDRINRVILMSDGGANIGITDADLIAENADDAEGEAIYMMGVGMANVSSYNDDLMDTITDAGKGAYIFIDSAEEAQRMFSDRLLQNVEVAARNVQVELTMPPTFRMDEFHGEEYSENPEEVEPQHLAPNDAMIFHQIIASCDPSSLDPADGVTVMATYETPFTREPRSVTEEMNLGVLMTGDNELLVKGNAIVAYAQALEDQSTVDNALEEVRAAIEILGNDADLLEIEELLMMI